MTLSPERLGPDERRSLLRLARGSIREAICGVPPLEGLLQETQLTPALREPRGAFVSLKRAEKLRGCIGNLFSAKALYRSVIELAPRAAMHDPRFAPLTADELLETRIEISALTPARPLARVDDLVIGRDGVQLKKGQACAVFLPQVAVEQGWSAEVLLEHLAHKADLPQDGWREAELSVFSAEVFGEPLI